MLQTINGFDLMLVMIIAGLVFIISMQKQRIADLKVEMYDRYQFAYQLGATDATSSCNSWDKECDDPWCTEHCVKCFIAEGWCGSCGWIL